jgi:hypothetical protein
VLHSSRGRHIIAREGGHWLLLDQPEMVAEAIERVAEEIGAVASPR